jgi:small subunit ribosomal protein S14
MEINGSDALGLCPCPLFKPLDCIFYYGRKFVTSVVAGFQFDVYTCLPTASRILNNQANIQVCTMANIRVLRDIKARNTVRASEVARRAYLYVARNQSLSPQIRHQAQLQLNTFGRYARPTTVKNRCHESGRGRGIISEFALCRVSYCAKNDCIVLIFTVVSISIEGTQR